MMPKKILIISYTFPPSAGIGGRRWAKFAKYFKARGLEVQVICAEHNLNSNSPWIKDILEYKQNITQIPSFYPPILSQNPKTIWEKLRYKFALIWLKIGISGNYYDRASYMQLNLTKSIENHIQKGVQAVIVSVAPFKLATFSVPLIHKYPNVKFVLDFRDPWTCNKTSYGFELLSPTRLEMEKKSEELCVRTFHHIVSVSDEIHRGYIQKWNLDPTKFHVIPNGFDPNEVYSHKVTPQNSEDINLLFTGTYYWRSEWVLKELSKQLSELKQSHESLYNRLKFHFYGNISFSTKALSDEHRNLIFHGTVRLEKVYYEIQSALACMLFLTDDIPYSFSTKFCEYIAFKKPIIVFSEPGYTASYVVNNKIGIHVNTQDFNSSFQNFIKMLQDNKLNFNSSFDIDQFNVQKLADQYIHILNS